MSKRFNSQHEIDTFLKEPRLAMLIYPGSRPAPTGVPVWFDWDGKMVRMFTGRTSPKVRQLTNNPNISVLVTNRVGEPEGWVAFDGKVAIKDFSAADWSIFLNRVAPRYWDLTDPAYAKEIEGWRAVPEAFVTLELEPEVVRSGAQLYRLNECYKKIPYIDSDGSLLVVLHDWCGELIFYYYKYLSKRLFSQHAIYI